LTVFSLSDKLNAAARFGGANALSIVCSFFLLACILSSSVALAGANRVRNNSVKAECAAKADAEHLTGHERHMTVAHCVHEGVVSAHRY